MKTTLYCHKCEKSYQTTNEAIIRMQKFDPEHLVVSGNVYSYSGGCFFKNLNHLKRMDKKKIIIKG